jgi:hypothetical protein
MANTLKTSHRVSDAVDRVVAEIADGLRHGFFEVTITCEIVSGNRRRLIVKSGKSYQFSIAEDECVVSLDSRHGSATNGHP